MTDFSLFLPICKIDEEKRHVFGYASTPRKDSDGEIVTLNAVKDALPEYMAFGNIREMHKLSAVGTAEEANVDDKGLFITAKIVDDAAWKKCLEGVYKGFSIGGRKLSKQGNKITAIEMTEISVVDRPANPDARFALAKSAKTIGDAAGFLLKVKKQRSAEGKALAKMAKIVGDLAKAGPPAAHDGFSLPAKLKPDAQPDGVPSVKDSRPTENVTRKADTDIVCEKHGKANCAECLVDKAGVKPAPTAKPLKAKPHKKAKKLAKAELARIFDLRGEDFLTLRRVKDLVPVEDDDALDKSMSTAGTLAYCFDSIRSVQRSLLLEGNREGGDGKDAALAKQLGTIAKQLAAVISQKSEHEGEEALSLTDADDQYVTSILGEGLGKMTLKADVAGDTVDVIENDDDNGAPLAKTGDALADAIAMLVKRAATPSRAMRIKSAAANIKKARAAEKEARKAVEDAHAMHKAAYIAKASGKKKPKGDDEDDDASGEFDHTGAMEKLQKAFAAIEKARTFSKAAEAQLEKASRSGQRGQETGDPEGDFYSVPPGVKDLSPSALAGAGPGTKGGGSQPPAYPTDGGVYPGKAAGLGDLQKMFNGGPVPVGVVEMMVEKARAEGELEVLRRMPAAGARQRPFTFDLTKAVGDQRGGDSLQKALFDGVNAAAIGSGDERAHTEASARVIGNLLTSGHFGKSVIDPNFKGAAGTH
jgi:hypothetical protein